MKKALDVKHINPFLQSSLNIFESMVQMKLQVGKPAVGTLKFDNRIFIIQVGVTGEMKGQVLLVMSVERAKEIASRMMGGMPVAELDELSRSALGELCNMIMGSTATLFSSQGILIDITPPLSLLGSKLTLQADIQSIRVPLLTEGEEFINIYICVSQE
ncbi:MAG: chemotaxis protein CheX [Acetatifactor sp.]|nr:chemotaxis protein CheX [Acetatifactor sp.]